MFAISLNRKNGFFRVSTGADAELNIGKILSHKESDNVPRLGTLSIQDWNRDGWNGKQNKV
jgi:hypothetical protein